MIKAVGRQSIGDEFLNNKLCDKRLRRRLVHLAELMDSKFESNIPHACGGWKEVIAAYRFFSNPYVDPDSIQMTHFANTIARINDLNQEPLILVQDTTTFNYQAHPATLNLGPIGHISRGNRSTKGIYCHSAMIYTIHGTPLGLLFQKFWLRKKRTRDYQIRRRKKVRTMPISKKESYRWAQGAEVASLTQQQTQKRIIIVADNECDINEVFRVALEHKNGFVIRTDKVRTCVESFPLTILNYLISSHFCDEMEIDVIFREKICTGKFGHYHRLSPKHRKALVKIWWKKVTIEMRDPSSSKKIRIQMNVVLAQEHTRPSDKIKEPLSWILFTNEQISTNEDARKIITYYKCRWQIEEYHRIYKAGCKVEQCRLGYAERLIKYLKIMGIIAWRQHYLTEVGREFSELPASTCLSPMEIQSLKLDFKDIVNSQLTLGEAWHLVAQLGGFFNRKSDGNPGPTTFWRGLQQIIYTTRGIEQAYASLKQSTPEQSKAA